MVLVGWLTLCLQIALAERGPLVRDVLQIRTGYQQIERRNVTPDEQIHGQISRSICACVQMHANLHARPANKHVLGLGESPFRPL